MTWSGRHLSGDPQVDREETVARLVNSWMEMINNTIAACFVIAMTIAVAAVLFKFCSTTKHFYMSESWTKSFEEYLQSSQVLLEAQGP